MNIIKYVVLALLIFPLHANVNYTSEIQPIFDNHCISCHVNGGAYFGNFDLSSYAEAIEGGDSGNTIVPFDFENSLLWQYVNSSYMPPYSSGIDLLTSNQIDLIAQWIGEGALLESNECLLADINGDETINILDVVTIVSIILDGEFIECGDINEDSIINILDVVLLIEVILSPQLPNECYIVPEVGPCFGICPTYYYNQSSNQCEEFITGCCGIDAFNTLQECQNTCE